MRSNIKYIHATPVPFDPAVWLQRRRHIPPATARLLAEIIGFHRPDDHIGAPAKKAVRA